MARVRGWEGTVREKRPLATGPEDPDFWWGDPSDPEWRMDDDDCPECRGRGDDGCLTCGGEGYV